MAQDSKNGPWQQETAEENKKSPKTAKLGLFDPKKQQKWQKV